MLLAQSIALGLFIGFFVFELTGLVAGGLVTSGYFALYVDQPILIAEAIAVAFITLFIVRGIGSFSLLYGRRRFIVTILVGFSLQWLVGAWLWGIAVSETRVDALGFIIPGLLAYEMERQGIGKTLVVLLLVTMLVRLSLRALGLI